MTSFQNSRIIISTYFHIQTTFDAIAENRTMSLEVKMSLILGGAQNLQIPGLPRHLLAQPKRHKPLTLRGTKFWHGPWTKLLTCVIAHLTMGPHAKLALLTSRTTDLCYSPLDHGPARQAGSVDLLERVLWVADILGQHLLPDVIAVTIGHGNVRTGHTLAATGYQLTVQIPQCNIS